MVSKVFFTHRLKKVVWLSVSIFLLSCSITGTSLEVTFDPDNEVEVGQTIIATAKASNPWNNIEWRVGVQGAALTRLKQGCQAKCQISLPEGEYTLKVTIKVPSPIYAGRGIHGDEVVKSYDTIRFVTTTTTEIVTTTTEMVTTTTVP